jgi:HKD family nuclease
MVTWKWNVVGGFLGIHTIHTAIFPQKSRFALPFDAQFVFFTNSLNLTHSLLLTMRHFFYTISEKLVSIFLIDQKRKKNNQNKNKNTS